MARLDVYLSIGKLTKSREQAKRLISDGKVTVNGKVVKKPSAEVLDGDEVQVTQPQKYVGRGAYKLLKAFDVFSLDASGKTCADLGASTGGFTQVLLENGAKRVYAVDVGHAQLDSSLLSDERVVNLEGVNVRALGGDFFSDYGEKPQLVCCDLSFISLRLVLPSILSAVSDNAELVLLIKPQFEAGRDALNKNGIVKDKARHIEVLKTLCDFFADMGLCLLGLDYSPISGGDGNIEYLAYLARRSAKPQSIAIKPLVDKAFSAGL